MSTIPLSTLFAEWRKDPEYMREYEALEEEFALAAALIKARSDAARCAHRAQSRTAQDRPIPRRSSVLGSR